MAATAAADAAASQIIALERQLQQSNDALAALSQEFLKYKNDTLMAIGALEKAVTTSNDDLAKAKAVVLELQHQATAGNREYAATKKQLDESIAGTSRAVAVQQQLQQRISELEGQGRQDKESIESLTANFADLLATKEAADKANAAMQTQAVADKNDIDKLTQQLNVAKETLTALAAEYQGYKESMMKTTVGLETKGKNDANALTTVTQQFSATTAEYKGYKDKSETTIATLQAQGKKDEVNIASLKKQNSNVLAQFTALTKEYQGYKSTFETTVSELNANLANGKEEYAQHLKECKLAAEKAVKSIADAQAQLGKRNDELIAMTKTNTELTTAKVTNDKEIEALKKQLSTLQASSSKSAEKATKSIADLEATSKQMKDQMTSLTKEYQTYKISTEKTVKDLVKVKDEYAQHLKECKLAAEKAAKSIAELEATSKQMKDQMTSLAKEYQTYKTMSETTVSELNASLVKGKEEYTQHLNECKLTTEKATKSITDLQEQLRTRNDELIAMTTTNTELTASLNALTIEHRQYKETKENNSRELSSKNNRDTASISALRMQIEDMQAAASTHATAQDEAIAIMTAQHTTDTAEINNLKSQLETATNTLQLLAKEFQLFKSLTQKTAEETQVKTRNDATLYATLLEEKAVLLVEMGQLGKQISDLEHEYATAKAAGTAQDMTVAGLQREVMLEKQRVWDITAAKDKDSQQRAVQINALQQQIQELMQETTSLGEDKKQLRDDLSRMKHDASVAANMNNDEMYVLLSKQRTLENQVTSLRTQLNDVKTSDASHSVKIADLQSQLVEKSTQLTAAERASSQTAATVEKSKQQALLDAQRIKSADDKTIASLNTMHMTDTAEINNLKSQLEGDSVIDSTPHLHLHLPSSSVVMLCTLHDVAVLYMNHQLRCFVLYVLYTHRTIFSFSVCISPSFLAYHNQAATNTLQLLANEFQAYKNQTQTATDNKQSDLQKTIDALTVDNQTLTTLISDMDLTYQKEIARIETQNKENHGKTLLESAARLSDTESKFETLRMAHDKLQTTVQDHVVESTLLCEHNAMLTAQLATAQSQSLSAAQAQGLVSSLQTQLHNVSTENARRETAFEEQLRAAHSLSESYCQGTTTSQP